MERLDIKIVYSGVTVCAEFHNKLNLLSGFSGTGKTFLMQAIELYCLNEKINCIYCDFRYMYFDEEQIKIMCKNAEVVLLDNADLYLTDSILSWLKEQGKMLIICMKDTSYIDMEDMHEYIVSYENEKIIIEEF